MLKHILLFSFLYISIFSKAQKFMDTLYLKTGTTLKQSCQIDLNLKKRIQYSYIDEKGLKQLTSIDKESLYAYYYNGSYFSTADEESKSRKNKMYLKISIIGTAVLGIGGYLIWRNKLKKEAEGFSW